MKFDYAIIGEAIILSHISKKLVALHLYAINSEQER